MKHLLLLSGFIVAAFLVGCSLDLPVATNTLGTDAAKSKPTPICKNELVYDPLTWSAWTNKPNGHTIVNGYLHVENLSTTTMNLEMDLKRSTKYGILITVRVNTRSIGTYLYASNAGRPFNSDISVAAGFTGTVKSIGTSIADITLNSFGTYLVKDSGVIEFGDMRVFELPTGSQIEADFSKLSADQLNVLYPFVVAKDTAVNHTITLAAKGASDYVIVVPDVDDRNRVKKAADLLQSTLTEAVGCKLPVVKEAEAPADKPHIYLGKTKAAKDAGVPLDTLKEWTFCKRIVGKDLFLAGVDASLNITNQPNKEYLGTFKAVTSFLEDEVGVRFLLPGSNGTFIPKLNKLKVDAGLNSTVTSKIPYCYGRFYWQPGDVTNIANNHFDLAYWKTYGGHSYYDAVPMLKYAETHPEYFALVGGKRLTTISKTFNNTSLPGHLCISNPDVQELMLKEMEKQLDLGYEWVALGQTDGYRSCECDSCKAITAGCKEYDGTGVLMQYGNPEAVWIVHRKLAEEMKKRRPGKKVVIIAYGPTVNPPRTFKEFPDNVVIEMCAYTPEAFEMWKKFPCEKLVYIYNWGSYPTVGFLPKRTPDFAAKQLRLFAANNVKGIYKCGFGECLGLEGPVYYVYGKLLVNPDAEPKKLADDFYRGAYGKAHPAMKMFFDSLHKQLEYNQSLPSQPEAVICYLFPPNLIARMEDQLKYAFTLDNDPQVQARLRLVQREFLYLKNTVSIFTYYRAYLMNGSWEAFNMLDTELKRRDALIDSWFVENEKAKTDPKAPKWVMKVEDGWSQFFGNYGKDFIKKNGGYYDGGASSATLNMPPFSWDMAKMRETKKSSGGGTSPKMKTLKIARLSQPVAIDGTVSEAAWGKATVNELNELGGGTTKENATFRAAYDDANLYFAFDCAFADIAQAKFTPLGRDGACWNDECLELFLDTLGTREKYYHFIFNPVPNSFYDARFRYIEDLLDPGYGQEEVLWNGSWEYVAKVDKEHKRWTAEVKIPFAALGVPAPKPGVKWTMNVAREHYYPNKETGKKDCELSAWSPNLEERSFTSPGAFGTLEFE